VQFVFAYTPGFRKLLIGGDDYVNVLQYQDRAIDLVILRAVGHDLQ
jgi:hypothetical protein